MKKKRLSREEGRELTSQRLVESAQRLIARHGLDGTSVEDIAESAGYSRGAFYSNFKSKNDLFFEVLLQDQQRNNAQFAQSMDDAMPLEQIRERIGQIFRSLHHDNDAFLAWTEARMLSARDPKFRARLSSLIQERRDFIANIIGYLCKRMGTTATVPLENLAMGFISLNEGLRLFGASCPSILSTEVAQRTQEMFLDAVLQHFTQHNGPTRAG